MIDNIYTFDFETTEAINGSNMAPYPVGVSIKKNAEPSNYYSWGHPTNNNCALKEGLVALKVAYDSGYKLLCHNAKFDLRVAKDYFNLPVPKADRILDTMIMAYLIDAREASLGLKQLAEKYCGMAPDAQDELNSWIEKNVSKTNQGAYICNAPGDLVGKYAESDTDMTYALYITLQHQVFGQPVIEGKQNIGDAYRREQLILPIVIDMESRGIGIADGVSKVCEKLEKRFELIDMQLSAYSGGKKPGSKAMFQAFRDKGLIDEAKIQYTPKGNPRYSKDVIEDIVNDPNLLEVLKIRSKLQKLLSTYVRPFSVSSSKYKGKFFPYYNQTRSEGDYGTRTGRFSSNIQQLPKDSGANTDLIGRKQVDDLPSVRSLMVPSSPNKSFVKFDFSGQEIRVTAHYAEGKILKAYQDDPGMDVHSFVEDLIIEMTGYHLSRTPVKMISFLKLYGGGPKALAKGLQIEESKAREFFQAYDSALPEFKNLMKDIETLARGGTKIRTWGGRSYGVETSKDGREFYYKLGNILIQGSSADMTKEAMIRYHYHPDRLGDIVMTVHDEIVVEVDDEYIEQEAKLLKWAMDEIPGWDVPLLSDGCVGKNLANMKDYKVEP